MSRRSRALGSQRPLRMPLLALSLAVAAAFAPRVALASLDPAPHVEMVWTETPPTLDGRLDEEVWKTAAVIDDFHTAEPRAGGRPSQRTVIRILSDRDAMYVGIECYDDEPDGIVVNHMLRDDVDTYYDDRLNIVIDPFLDRRNGYLFQVNPVGTRRDGLIEGPNFEPNWDGIWAAKARVGRDGWFAEVRIPYKTLSFDPAAKTWGLNFSRGIRRRNEDIRWADPVPHRIVTNTARAGFLDGMGRQVQGVGLDVVPAATTRRVDDRLRDKHYFLFDPSLDAFYRITPGLTGSLTVNTDFGETEVDERQINLDRFQLFFPEKRDFFLQDALIFDFGALSANVEDIEPNGRPFFSRKIGLDADGNPVAIRAAAKVTGRVGRFNVGLLDAQVEGHTLKREDALGRFVERVPGRPDADQHVGTTNLLVGRATMNVLRESRVGFIVTNGDPRTNRSNSLAGVDFDFRDSDFLGTGQVVQGNVWAQNSFTEGGHGTEAAYGGELQLPNDHHFVFLNFRDIAKDFYPALGFVSRADIRRYEGRYRYRTRPPSRLVRTFDNFVWGILVTDRENEVQSLRVDLRPIDIETHTADGLEIAYRRGFERVLVPFPLPVIPQLMIPAGTYHTDEIVVEAESSKHRRLSTYVEARYGGFLSGRRAKVLARVDWRPSRFVRFGLEYDHSELWLDVVNAANARSEVRTAARIARVRVNFQFTPDVSWLTFVQYDNASDRVGVNSRLRWIVSDGREIFLVYNQLLLADDGDVTSVRTEPLAKVGWTFRF
ncbi:MAG: carbohydrate binding family 9 domain-containing protein [Myxococcota bacterium]|nr:carbohydrate binding family 9 domain-containing protein [Myxococcales bacterium]